MTLLTVFAFIAGTMIPLSMILSVILYMPILLYPFQKRINHLDPIHIGYCTISMYIMGIVDIYSVLNFNLFSLYILMTTIRFYA